QSRNALFEIILALDPWDIDPSQETDPEQAANFLTAFTAAGVLIDAAIFLRNRYHQATAIRKKLDEPDPTLGVPAGIYETVQHSLTKPSNAWRMLQARRNYLASRAKLTEILSAEDYAPLFKIADRLSRRLRPTFATYLKTRVRVWGRFFANLVRRDLIGLGLFHVQKYVSELMADVSVKPGHRPCVPEEIRQQLIEHLQPGDVFVVRKEFAITNYFLPGYWPHAALYLGCREDLSKIAVEADPGFAERTELFDHCREDAPRPHGLRVLEAMKDGVLIRSVDSPLASDSVVILRPQLSQEQIAEGFCRAIVHEGKPYDFDFDFTCSHRMVCTEVVYRAYDGLGDMRFQLERHAGRMALGAQGLIEMGIAENGFSVVAVYSPDDSTEVLLGESASEILRRRSSVASSSSRTDNPSA
ncbi:MAG: YiiX/YebB-like N1pC/P60 family cysteine hydrolase, partial [Lacipirellulaceae bacterium]